jgi:DNA-binding response OmpR family regulator
MPSLRSGPGVLVVEDNEDTRDLLVFALKRDGYLVLEADSCAEGLRALREGPAVDLVISDYSLGDEDGLRMVERARAEGLLVDEPIILWTARHNVRAPAPIVVLQKPLGTDELLAAARRLIHGREVRGEASYGDPPREPGGASTR